MYFQITGLYLTVQHMGLILLTKLKGGVWIPKSVSGLTFGTLGFYLKFEDSSNLGKIVQVTIMIGL